jgi:hypothetical protein
MKIASTVKPVPLTAQANAAVNFQADRNETIVDRISVTITAQYGVRWCGCTFPKKLGSTPIRPMLNSTRPAFVTAADAHAMLEFTRARKIRIQSEPQYCLANGIHELKPLSL